MENKDNINEGYEDIDSQFENLLTPEEEAAETPVVLEEVLPAESLVDKSVEEALAAVKITPIVTAPSFSAGFRGYHKDEVDAFVSSLVEKYNKIVSTQNDDKTLLLKANDAIQKQARKIQALESKIEKPNKDKVASELAKIESDKAKVMDKAHAEADKTLKEALKLAGKTLDKASAEAAKIVAKAKAEASKQLSVETKLVKAAEVKAAKLAEKAEKDAAHIIDKAKKHAASIVESGVKEVEHAKHVLKQQKDTNDRLIAFYTTQIKTLKTENKKFNK